MAATLDHCGSVRSILNNLTNGDFETGAVRPGVHLRSTAPATIEQNRAGPDPRTVILA